MNFIYSIQFWRMPLKQNEIDDVKRFGENIRRLRLQKKWSMEYLANHANIELSQIYRIEKGKVNPKLTTIIILCKALDVNPEQVISI